MLDHAGHCRHTQNIQINKVIGANEKYVFYFNTKRTCWPGHYSGTVMVYDSVSGCGGDVWLPLPQ